MCSGWRFWIRSRADGARVRSAKAQPFPMLRRLNTSETTTAALSEQTENTAEHFKAYSVTRSSADDRFPPVIGSSLRSKPANRPGISGHDDHPSGGPWAKVIRTDWQVIEVKKERLDGPQRGVWFGRAKRQLAAGFLCSSLRLRASPDQPGQGAPLSTIESSDLRLQRQMPPQRLVDRLAIIIPIPRSRQRERVCYIVSARRDEFGWMQGCRRTQTW